MLVLKEASFPNAANKGVLPRMRTLNEAQSSCWHLPPCCSTASRCAKVRRYRLDRLGPQTLDPQKNAELQHSNVVRPARASLNLGVGFASPDELHPEPYSMVGLCGGIY